MASHESDALAKQQCGTWEQNASAWTQAVRGGQIASREVTDRAIVDAVNECGARRVLDIGCGEGWLVHELAAGGGAATGMDASASLVAAARKGPGRFLHLSYEDFVAAPERIDASFDAAVCNFSLLDERIDPLLRALRTRLKPEGHLLIQTVHPFAARGDAPYRDGWREESFDGFGQGFSTSMPWYYRTLGAWIDAVRQSGFAVERCAEPLATDGDAPLSLLLVCSKV